GLGQDLKSEGVKGADHHAVHVDGLKPSLHLLTGFPRKGKQKDLGGIGQSCSENEPALSDDGAGLAGARPRHDEAVALVQDNALRLSWRERIALASSKPRLVPCELL